MIVGPRTWRRRLSRRREARPRSAQGASRRGGWVGVAPQCLEIRPSGVVIICTYACLTVARQNLIARRGMELRVTAATDRRTYGSRRGAASLHRAMAPRHG